jgi:hypothetical protein
MVQGYLYGRPLPPADVLLPGPSSEPVAQAIASSGP